MQIVAQLDRFRGGFSGDGNWTGTRRFYVTQDDDLNRIGSKLIADLGEVNMADPNTLVDFVTWAMRSLPGRQVRADPVRPRHGLAGRLERPRRPHGRTQRRSIPLAGAWATSST